MTTERVRVGRVGEIEEGTGTVVKAGGRMVALFNVGGTYYAVDNTCPHRGGPLGEGDVAGRVVTCPWHAWEWDVTSGANANNPAVQVACFPVSVEGDDIVVEVTARD